MAKKDALIYFLRIMSRYSDAEHPLKVRQIMELMKSEYGVTVTKQTVYNYIDLLNEMDLEINDSGTGKYISYRVLEKSEVELLIHSIVSNSTISRHYTDDLAKKLLSTQSKYYTSNITKFYNVDKKDNRELFLNIEVISECIQNKQKVKFMYTKYNTNKEIVDYREKPYTVTPLCIVCRDGRFYFVCKYDTKDGIFSFRLDKIRNCQPSKHKIEIEYHLDPYDYSKNRLYMYGGDIHTFTLQCSKVVLDDIIESFGTDVKIYNETENTFDCEVQTTDIAIKFFTLQFINFVVVLKPQKMRDEIKHRLEQALTKY